MPLLIPEHFPAMGLLEKEKLVLPEIMQKDVQVRIAILNLMPMKVSAEADYIRLLANSPLNVEIRWMKLLTPRRMPRRSTWKRIMSFSTS